MPLCSTKFSSQKLTNSHKAKFYHADFVNVKWHEQSSYLWEMVKQIIMFRKISMSIPISLLSNCPMSQTFNLCSVGTRDEIIQKLQKKIIIIKVHAITGGAILGT